MGAINPHVIYAHPDQLPDFPGYTPPTQHLTVMGGLPPYLKLKPPRSHLTGTISQATLVNQLAVDANGSRFREMHTSPTLPTVIVTDVDTDPNEVGSRHYDEVTISPTPAHTEDAS